MENTQISADPRLAGIQPNKAQWRAINSDAIETFCICGVAAGKTFLLGILLYMALSRPGAVCGLFAPNRKVLQKATWPQIRSVWNLIGMKNGVHYVINRLPPPDWGVEPFSDVGSNSILTTAWGSYCIMDGLENFDGQRGTEFDEVFTDEFRDIKEAARLVLLTRMRGKLYTLLGIPQRLWHVTTPPDNPGYLIELRDNAKKLGIKFVFAPTHVNKHNLPSNYITNLENTLDTLTFRREVRGELVAGGNKLFAYSFNKEKHVSKETGDTLFNPLLPVYLSFDFNVDPATCIAAQWDNSKLTIIKEFYLRQADLYELCETINTAYPSSLFYVTGDATGQGRSSLSKGLLNSYEVIEAEMGINTARFLVPTVNPAVRDTRILVNSLLQHYPDIKIAADCPKLIKDLELVQMDKNNDIDKKSDIELTHLLDCARYLLNTLFPDYIANARKLLKEYHA